MNSAEFLEFGKEMMEFVANYLDTIQDRQVLPSVEPGYMSELVPYEAPEVGESWKDVMKDIEPVIMPGITHFNSPHFHAYFATSSSYPSIVSDLLCNGLSVLGVSWHASPAATELEIRTLDWVARATSLPEQFMHDASGGKGGGVIQGSASESTFVALLTARNHFAKMNVENPDFNIEKLVVYTSDQAHSSVEKAANLGAVRIRMLETDDNFALRASALLQAIETDLNAGLIPFFVTATLGTTSTCSFDPINEIGEVCAEMGLWFHVDAAYAGTAWICKEYRYLANGLEKADSYVVNPYKMMLVHHDCSALHFKNAKHVEDAFWVDPVYLKYDGQGRMPDFRHWQIALTRRFRALKLWFVLRIYGLEKIREHVRSQFQLAQEFKTLVEADDRFEIVAKVVMGLVAFRLKGAGNEGNEKLLRRITERRKIHMVPSVVKGKYILRFSVSSKYTTSKDVEFAWNEIKDAGKDLGLLDDAKVNKKSGTVKGVNCLNGEGMENVGQRLL